MKVSTHTQVAKLIRQELKALNITAKVKSELNCVRIYLINADYETDCKVAEIAKKYQCGSFNADIDLYEDTNVNPEIPQVRYVIAHNEIDEEIYQKALDYLHANFANEEHWTLDRLHERGNHVTPEMMDEKIKTKHRMQYIMTKKEFWASI